MKWILGTVFLAVMMGLVRWLDRQAVDDAKRFEWKRREWEERERRAGRW